MFSDSGVYKVGDLIRVLTLTESSCFVFRPYGFPFGKVGLVVEIDSGLQYYTETEKAEPHTYPYGAYEYDYRLFYDDLLVILVEGKKYWVFHEEVEKYINEEEEN